MNATQCHKCNLQFPDKDERKTGYCRKCWDEVRFRFEKERASGKTRVCTSCLVEKENTESYFSYHDKKANRLRTVCKQCCNLKKIQRRKNNLEKHLTIERERYIKYRDDIRARAKRDRAKYRHHHHKYYERVKKDATFRLRKAVSTSIHFRLKKLNTSKRGQRSFDKLGYTAQQLKEHLESQFEPWMNWENYGVCVDDKKTWHIDHIYPHSLLPYSSMDDENFKKCWALENLRPLEAKANIAKGNKVIPAD